MGHDTEAELLVEKEEKLGSKVSSSTQTKFNDFRAHQL